MHSRVRAVKNSQPGKISFQFQDFMSPKFANYRFGLKAFAKNSQYYNLGKRDMFRKFFAMIWWALALGCESFGRIVSPVA